MDKKQKKKLYKILFALATVAFLISAGMLLSFWWDYHKADSEYRQVAEGAVTVRQNVTAGPAGQSGETAAGEAAAGETVEEDPNQPALVVDFGVLAETNPDVIAWIDFPGQDVSYPVVQGQDNDRYLHWTFNGSRSASGAIFLDSRNDGLMLDGNTIIYGHNMKNGSMFGSLKNYRERTYFEQYPYFDIYTREGVYRCGIISAGQVRPYEESYQLTFTDEADRAEYISLIRQMQYYEVPDVESDDSVPMASYVEILAEDGENADGSGETADEAGESAGADGASAGSDENVPAAGSDENVPAAEEDDDAEPGSEETDVTDGAPPLVLLSTCTGGSHAYRFVLLAQVQKFYPEQRTE